MHQCHPSGIEDGTQFFESRDRGFLPHLIRGFAVKPSEQAQVLSPAVSSVFEPISIDQPQAKVARGGEDSTDEVVLIIHTGLNT
jgi:hypothetical protein